MTHSLGATPLQTNKSTAPANGVLVDISPCQSAPSSGSHASPFRCVRARNQCVIISTLSSLSFFFFRRHRGGRGIDMTRSAQGGHKYIQIIFCLLSRRPNVQISADRTRQRWLIFSISQISVTEAALGAQIVSAPFDWVDVRSSSFTSPQPSPLLLTPVSRCGGEK